MEIGNEPFTDHSWYFRNALVRANYTNLDQDVHETSQFLEAFFENALLGAKHDLKNRYLHIDWISEAQSAKSDSPKCKVPESDGAFGCTLEELAVLKLLDADPTMTQKTLATKLGVSERTIKTRTVKLQTEGLLARVGGKRNGHWAVSGEIRDFARSKAEPSASMD